MSRRVALRAGLLQLLFVAVLGGLLAVAVGHDFFKDNGWWAGPLAWLACAAAVGAILGLALGSVLIGAVLVGIPSALATAVGLHWEGALLAIVLFGLWCGRLAQDPDLIEEIV
jgi:hypothetical protein